MVRCLSPHCKNTNNLITIPKLRNDWSNNRGKRKYNKENNDLINEMNYAWRHIIKTHIPGFVYDVKSRTTVIC